MSSGGCGVGIVGCGERRGTDMNKVRLEGLDDQCVKMFHVETVLPLGGKYLL